MAWSTPKQIKQAKLWMLLGTITSAKRYVAHWKRRCKDEGIFLNIDEMQSQFYYIEREIRKKMKELS